MLAFSLDYLNSAGNFVYLVVVFVLTFVISLHLGKNFIPYIKKIMNQGQPIRDYGPHTHLDKRGTPNVGSIIIFVPFYVVLLFFCDWRQNWYFFASLIAFNLLGLLDDYYKATKKKISGIAPKHKLLVQLASASFFVFCFFCYGAKTTILIPFYGDLDLKFLTPILAVFAIVGASNAVNLTDGLDGLVSIPVAGSALFFLVANNLIGANNDFLSVAIVSFVGGLIAFLWYNTYPARIFMGDGGSLACGAFLGFLSVILGLELFLIICGLLFVIETLSVIAQILYFRKTKGKRLFLMTPIHHHFEQLGMHESTITTRMWIFSTISSLMAAAFLYITLKS